jgi:23S rRNA (adenine2503-C2)-methyltransferase
MVQHCLGLLLITMFAHSTQRLARAFSLQQPTKNAGFVVSLLHRPVPPRLVSRFRCTSTNNNQQEEQHRAVNLSTASLAELETLVVGLGHAKFRSRQIYQWIRHQGQTDPEQMINLPLQLRNDLVQHTQRSSLQLVLEQVSKDGTVKRAYRCGDGQVVESVLMPYADGRYTACISSQAGCAQGCVFCATGQMGFSRQLSRDEIYEQVARFATELTKQDKDNNNKQSETESQEQQNARQKRLSNVVFMGMGEPLANYRNVMSAIDRITDELGIGARKITVSTVGIVPNIRKLIDNPKQVRLAVSLHCATDQERTALLPANRRNGGLKELMTCLYDYITVTGRRITLEWALIQGENDSVETAQTLGRLIQKYKLRRDMVHINVIPLNPTGGYTGGPSQRARVNLFCKTLQDEFGIACTPRVRRGIDIDAGCGQLKSQVLDKELRRGGVPLVGIYEDAEEEEDSTILSTNTHTKLADEDFGIAMEAIKSNKQRAATENNVQGEPLEFHVSEAVDFESDDFEDPEFNHDWQQEEAARIISLVKGGTATLSDLK